MKKREKKEKRTVYAIGPFANGHVAAEQFCQQNWGIGNYTIVFCEDHKDVVQKLTSTPRSYAVLPVVNNSDKITETNDLIRTARREGYVLPKIGQTTIGIDHRLLAKSEITLKKITAVYSKEQALGQCKLNLSAMGLCGEMLKIADSTAKAGEIVKASNDENVVALASPLVASEYGLTVLTGNMSDNPRNRTKFHAYYNPAKVEKSTVAIIGICGEMGQLFKSHFRRLGCKVIGMDPRQKRKTSIGSVIKRADVVVFSVPAHITVDLIKEYSHLFRKDQLVMDVTSLKSAPVEAMLLGKASVTGTHPMFKPDAGFLGQIIAHTPTHRIARKWQKWIKAVLTNTGSTIREVSPAQHDQCMELTQVIPHTATVANVALLSMRSDLLEGSYALASPFYRISLAMMMRILTQDPKLYASIIVDNPDSEEIIRKRIKIDQLILTAIEEKRPEIITGILRTANEKFGPKFIRESNELFARIMSLLQVRYGPNTAILSFGGTANKKGLLHQISKVFDDAGIDMMGISSTLDRRTGSVEFVIGFTDSPKTILHYRAFKKIEEMIGEPVSVRYL